jgi:hypothetical protein
MFVHDRALHTVVKELAADGIADAEIAVRTGLARTTVRDIRRRRPRERRRCPRCWRPIAIPNPTPGDYAELLGFYLGDGYINALARTYRLRLSLDARHPKVVETAESLLRRVLPANRVARIPADDGGTVVLSTYSSHLPCLLPHHGPGVKHSRPIVLESWQRRSVEAEPWRLLRGLIWSDGSIFINRTGRYAYESVHFGNRSDDIIELFRETCDAVGIVTRRSGFHVRINRRNCVERLLAEIGRKT